MSSLSSGVYILRVKENNGNMLTQNFSKKIIQFYYTLSPSGYLMIIFSNR
ncbi:hypothetical protein KO493_09450 [Tamlana agarivorans]|uniref:Uncharacterized protein n=1 Tax=Pseudotamlana agarivorans TaxID=481183 RepID=A0ACC5U9C1_9FLAO|nr:hypothetical protein [Tamlana agarivorans]